MPLQELGTFAVLLLAVGVVVLWRIDSKLGELKTLLSGLSNSVGEIEGTVSEIGDSASSVAINLATRKL